MPFKKVSKLSSQQFLSCTEAYLTKHSNAKHYSSTLPFKTCYSFLIIYHGLHTDLEWVMEEKLNTSWLSASSEEETWLCSDSVSSKSEQRSSLEAVDGAGDTRAVYALSDGDQVLLVPGQSDNLSGSIITRRRSSSFKGMLSRRWFNSSAATVGSIPGQVDTKVCTSCIHWM